MSTQYVLQLRNLVDGEVKWVEFCTRGTPHEALAVLAEAREIGYRPEQFRVVEQRPYEPEQAVCHDWAPPFRNLRPGDLICTRPRGHDGPHGTAWEQGHVWAEWDDRPNENQSFRPERGAE